MRLEYPQLGEYVHSKRLPNGLEIRVVEKKGFRHCLAFFCTRYGGMDVKFSLNGETYDTPAGIAHYLEHKMFDMPDGIDALQRFSVRGADANAFTSDNMTAYYFEATDQVEENLRLLLSFVSTPYFTKESVQKEQGIIAQEILMGEDDPGWQVYKNCMMCLYENNPIRIPVAGTVESISHITAETLYDCHKTFYHPSNMILTVVGDVDPEMVCSVAEEILPTTPKPDIQRNYGSETMRVKQKQCQISMEVAMPLFMLGYKFQPKETGPAFFKQSMIGDMAMDILCGSSSSLYNEMYSQGLINNSFGGCSSFAPGIGNLYVSGVSHSPEKIKECLENETKRLLRDGIEENYYQQIRRATYGQQLWQLNSFENIAVCLSEAYFRQFDFFQFPEIFDSITKDDLLAFLEDAVRDERSALCVVTPKEE